MPQRILFSESSSNLGGQELQLLQQMHALRQLGWEVRLACRPGSGIDQAARQQSLPTYPVPFRNSLHLASILRIRQLLRSWQPDVVVSHSGHDANVCGVAAKLCHPRPRMVRARTYQHGIPHAWPYNKLADLTLVPSRKLRESLLRNPRILAARIHVLYPGIDFAKIMQDRQQALPQPVADWLATHPGRAIVHAAMLRPEKGHALMLEVLAKLLPRFPDLRYVIAGAGELQEMLSRRVDELGLDEHVLFAGMLQPVAPLLQKAHLLVMPSLSEPLGMAQIEALSLETPVVASRVDGIPETIDHEETGLLVMPGDLAAWEGALAWALEHPQQMRAMAVEGRKRVLDKFSREANIKRFLHLIHGDTS